MEFLIKQKININVLGYNNNAPIHLAAKSGSSECMAILYKFGASIECKNDRNMMPLNIAIENKNF